VTKEKGEFLFSEVRSFESKPTKFILNAECTIDMKVSFTFTSVSRLEMWIPQGKSSYRHGVTRASLGDGGDAFLEGWSKLT
jgi:hypothetical protein